MPGETVIDTDDQLPDRHLDWPQCYNARDLGGLPARAGRTTRWQAMIRADTLGRLTAAGQQALLDYGVRTVIDLRTPQEAAKEPSLALQDAGHPLDYLNLPLEKYHPHVGALIRQATSRGEVYCIILDHYPDAVADIMRAVIQARPGGVVIHCHAGKDRTGIVVALLLSLVGVPHTMISADYAESQVRLWPIYARFLAETKDPEALDFWSRPTATVEMMDMMLAHVATQHGGAEQYLLAAGLAPEEIAQLTRRLLAP